ncbi:hypothetical protein MUO14_24150 [Halobacillus shinanisalinarum]|uniref:Uncharacterized protein n=1 Tax=Halobacillus shinanisalinarum TaxID=2932258 RepID=A0ABY4GZT4_9BACI|nr:hypothetical protein [Halobacillus shinanisalinarum]UOQ93423.1 hypothetical protein MUO14_24150 [Halobacillus shinanisalinarum]
MERREVTSLTKYMDGFDVTVTDDQITLGEGVLHYKGEEFTFEAASFILNREDRCQYDLYVVSDKEKMFFDYHLEMTYIGGGYIPAYTGDLPLFHKFMSLEINPGQQDDGYICHIRKGEKQEVKAGPLRRRHMRKLTPKIKNLPEQANDNAGKPGNGQRKPTIEELEKRIEYLEELLGVVK